MRRTIALRTSAAIGLVLGVLSVVAGGRVLADIDRPDYVVLHWLVIYAVGVAAARPRWNFSNS